MTEEQSRNVTAAPPQVPVQPSGRDERPDVAAPDVAAPDVAAPDRSAGSAAPAKARTPSGWRRARRWLSPLLSVAIIVGVFYFFLPQFTSISDVWKSARSMGPLALGGLLLTALWNLCTYWFVMVATMPGLRLREAGVVTESSTAVSNTLPGGGAIGIAMSYEMYYSWGFSRSRASVSLVVSGIWNNFAKLAMPILALALLALTGHPGGARVIAGLIGVGALAGALVVFGLMLHSQAFCARVGLVAQLAATGILRLLSKSPATGWDRATVKFRRRTILLLRARWLWITLTTVVSHVSLYAVLLTALRAVGVGQSEVSWIEVLAVFSFARLVTAVPLTPGGLGIVELALIGGLSAAGGPRAEVAAAVLIFRALTFVLPIPLGLVTYLYWKRNTSWRRPPGTAPRTELVPEDTSNPRGADSAAAGTVSADTVSADTISAGTVARDVRTTSAEQITKERYSSPGAGRSSPPKATFSRPWWVAGLAAGGLLVLVLAALPVDTHSVAGWERGIFRGVNNPTFLPFVLVWPVMQLGNFIVVPASGLVALALRRFRLAAALLIGGGLVYWLAKVVKHQVTRGRPFQLLPNVHIHGAASLGLGFPSGHAAVAVLVATVCWPYLRRRGRIVAATLAVLVCLARMYVGAHLPLDILAGAALGLAVGAALDVGLGYAATREEQPVPT